MLCIKVKIVPALWKKLLCFKPIYWLHILRKVGKFWLNWTTLYATRQHLNIQRSKLTHVINLGTCIFPLPTITTTTTDPHLYFLNFYSVLQGNIILKRALTFSFPILSQPLSVITISVIRLCTKSLDHAHSPYTAVIPLLQNIYDMFLCVSLEISCVRFLKITELDITLAYLHRILKSLKTDED